MSALKEKFDNYTPQPDPEVWENVVQSLHRRAIRRRLMVASSVAAVSVGTFALIFALKSNPTHSGAINSTDVVAENAQSVAAQQQYDAVKQEPAVIDINSPVLQRGTVNDDRTVLQEYSVNSGDESSASEQESDVHIDLPIQQQSRPQTSIPQSVPQDAVVQNSNSTQSVQTESIVDDNKPAVKEPSQRINGKFATSELDLWIPNAFSPDDPVEESARTFKVFPNTEASILSFEIYIYSRSGRLVYHSKDYNEGWDGTAKGQKQPMGTYVYIIEFKDAVKGLQHTKGTITLLR